MAWTGWNVNGLKSVVEKCSKDFLDVVLKESPDVLFLQETKIQCDMVPKYTSILPGYTQSRFACSTAKKGYSGTAAYIKSDLKILSTAYGLGDFLKDEEGRAITLEFQDFYFVGMYVANSGQGLVRLKYRTETYDIAVRNYIQALSKVKPVVLGGDLNVAHMDDDVYNFDAPHLKKQAGCTKEERESFTQFLTLQDRVDSFRALYPGKKVFSYWSTRAGNRPLNRGLRLDYFVVPREMMSPAAKVRLFDSWVVEDTPEKISDHAPVCCQIIAPVEGTM